jgi:hypothetical protein
MAQPSLLTLKVLPDPQSRRWIQVNPLTDDVR